MIRFAVIAAGEGSRLKQEGIVPDKPMVCIHGEPLLHRLVRIFSLAGASEVDIIVNAHMPEVIAYMPTLEQEFKEKLTIRYLVKSTPSSMHSFHAMAPLLTEGPFCLTTVDTIFREEDFLPYIHTFMNSSHDGMMAVTDYIDDEKPLYVGTDAGMKITGFYDERQEDTHYISGGIYCLRPSAIDTLNKCISSGQSRMRNFQRQLVADRLNLQAYAFPKILDIDHASDIAKAESFLSLPS